MEKKKINKTFYHSPMWLNSIRESYKIELFMFDSVPSFLIKSRLFGRKLVSIPFCDYGGSIVQDDFSELDKISRKHNVDYVEIRSLLPNAWLKEGFDDRVDYMRFCLDISHPVEKIWKTFSKKIRNSIRKAEKSGVKVKQSDDIQKFYWLYLKTMKRLGSPPHTFDFFKNIFKNCRDSAKLLVADYKGEKIAASVFFADKQNKRIYYWKNASDEKFHHLNANDMIIYYIIKWGIENKFKTLDLGRSVPGDGSYRFKKKWRADETQLTYYYKKYRKCEIPDYHKPKYKILGEFWKIVPLFLSKRVGPMLRKNFP